MSNLTSPPGYTLYMGMPNYPLTPHTTIASSNSNPTFAVFFYVLPNDGAAWLAPGFSVAPHVSDLTWAVSAGSLSDGLSAGAFRWRATSVSASYLLNRVNLIYTPTASNANVTTLNYVPPANMIGTYYNSPGGYIQYVGTQQAQYYIRQATGNQTGYTIEVYGQGVTYCWPNGQNGAWTFGSAPNITYTISSPDGAKVQIAQYVASSGITTTWTLYQSNGTTTVNQTNSTNSNILQVINLVSTTTGSTRQENITIEDGNNNVAVFKQRNYQTFNWGEEMVSEIDDPTALDSNGLNLTTTYTYYNTTQGDGEYSKLQSVTKPDGTWVQYDYYTDFARWGELEYVYTPFLDNPTSPSLATTTNCKLVTYSYLPERNVYSELNAGTATAINGTPAGLETITPALWTSTVYNEPMRTDAVQDYSAAGVYQTTVKKVFHNEADLWYNGKLYSQVNPDGTMVSASYWVGACTYNYLNSTAYYNSTVFTSISGASTWVENYLYGTVASTGTGSVQFTNDGVTGGNAIDPIYLTPYRSYRRQIQRDINGCPIIDVTEVYTGSGFQVTSWTTAVYDWQGLMWNYQKSTGEKWSCTRINGQINSEAKPDGTNIQYAFDPLMRTTQMNRMGMGASGLVPSSKCPGGKLHV